LQVRSVPALQVVEPGTQNWSVTQRCWAAMQVCKGAQRTRSSPVPARLQRVNAVVPAHAVKARGVQLCAGAWQAPPWQVWPAGQLASWN
jgi:hypothetical protein